MKFKWIRRMFSLLLCIVMLSTLIQVKEASATCYDHSKQNEKITKQPTCTAKGTKEYRCKNCNYLVKTESIAALGHNTSGTPRTVQPTSGKDGYTTAVCSRCYTETGTKTIIHLWGSYNTTKAATCTAKGSKVKKCQNCTATSTADIAALGHDTLGTPRTVQATCTTDGYTSATCSRCHIETGTKTVHTRLGHSYGNWVVTKNATCTTNGTRERKCTRCNQADPNKETITAYGHSYGDWKVTKNATCTAAGTKERSCTRCGYVDPNKQTIPALGHNTAGTPRVVQPTNGKDGYTTAVCSRCQTETGTKTVIHLWGDWVITQATCTKDGKKERSCKNCQKADTTVVIKALGHDTLGTPRTVQATCTTDGYTTATCSRCHIETGTKTVHTKLGHSYGNWVVKKNATCTATGTRERSCTRCGYVDPNKQTIPALGHNTAGTPRVVQPTNGKDGYTTAVCSRCQSETGTKTVIHLWGDWVITQATCTKDGKKERSCKNCKKADTPVVIKALGHDTLGNPKIVQKTCTTDGYTTATCSRCHIETGTKSISYHTGHEWSNWVITLPTCTKDGKKERICNKCKQPDTQITKALGHDTLGTPRIVQPTCTTNGYTSATCSRCHIETGTKSISKATHVWDDWKIIKQATCTSSGRKERYCKRCSNGYESVEIKPLGHDTLGTPRIVQPTCGTDGYVSAVCAKCQTEQGEKTILRATEMHTWGPWVESKKRTCEAKGERHRICSVCKKTESEELPELGHNVQGYRNVSPTCEEDGYSGAVCSRCSKVMDGAKIYPATGHEWGEWIIDKKPQERVKGERHRVCKKCQKPEKEDFIPETITIQFDWGWDHNESIKGNKYATVKVNEKFGSVFPVVGNPKSARITGWKDANGNFVDKNTIVTYWTDQVLTAVWDGTGYYVIRFHGNGSLSGTMEDMECDYGHHVIIPECDYDKGVGFAWWSTSKDGKGELYRPGDYFDKGLATSKNTSVIDLYAVWKDCSVKYHHGVSRVVFYNGTVKTGHTFKPKGISDFPSLKINGLTLVGWGDNPNGLLTGKVIYKIGTTCVNNLTQDLYPIYEITDKSKWAVFYDPNGGTGGPGIKFYDKGKEDIMVLADEPHRDGYTFLGWEYPFKASLLTADEWILGDWFSNENGSVRLVAKWDFTPRQLILDYGYDNKTDKIDIDHDQYTLPKPEDRKGYTFKGWGTDPNKGIYSAGAKYTPGEGSTTLYAVWEVIQFPIEYYDCYTNELIATVLTDCTKNLAGNLRTINGMDFVGWSEVKYINMNGSKVETVYDPGSSVSQLACNGKTVKLYSKYKFKKHDGILIVYHANGGYSAPTARTISSYSEIDLNDGLGVKKTGCDFKGWKSSYNFIFKNGKITGVTNGNPKEIILTADWVPNVKLILDYGTSGLGQDDISGKYIPGHKISVKELSKKEWKGHYLQGWTDQNGKYYPYYDEITVPSVDTVLTAVWGGYQYKIYYHNGFSGDLYDKPQETGFNAKIDYTPNKEEGYKFEGWVTSRPDEPPVDVKVKYRNGDETTISKDLHLYSCFSEERVTNQIQVVYNNKGGKGGPGTICFDRNPKDDSFKVSGALPTKEGYLFLGWSTSFYAGNADYEPNSCYADYIPEDGRITFYAVWVLDHTSDLKVEMQRRFGKDVMLDCYFDKEYKSTRWQKVNDFCYFVIKTTNEIDPDYNKYMTSTVMIIEFKNGKWVIESIGLEQSFSDTLRYYIDTHYNDSVGAMISFGLDALEYIASLTYVKYLLTALSVASFLEEFYAGDYDEEKFEHEYGVEFYSSLVDTLTEQAREAGMNEEEINQFLSENYDVLWGMCEEEASKMQIAMKNIAGKGISVTEKSVEIVEWWNENSEKVSDALSKKLNRKVSDRIVLPNVNISNQTINILSVLTAAVGSVMDIGEHYSGNMDVTGGRQNTALKAFHEELSNQGFSQDISNAFPELLVKMYKLYYGINY